jgi:hypothetical protein
MKALYASVSIVFLTIIILFLLGRGWWCPAGDFALWSFEVASQHNSQHLIDWYTPSHFSHGLIFAMFLLWALPKQLRSYALVFAVLLEAAWEVLENTPFIINRYRSATSAFDYFGDSIANSVADIAWCALGFAVAVRLGKLKSCIIFLALEVITLLCIRDNLTLNVIMLLHPIPAIKAWQLQ